MKLFWKGNRVLVTGGAGFIGLCLARHLVARGAHVVVFDQQPESITDAYQSIQTVKGNVVDYFLLQRVLSEYQIDTVFHLAAQTQVKTALLDPFVTYDTNIRGTYSLLEACRKHQIERIIVASSDKAYGMHEKLPYTEESSLRAIYPYDVSKACTDLIALSYYRTYQLPVVVTRAGNIYGGGDCNWDRLIPSTIRSLYENKPPVLRSDGKNLRDYVFVEDIVQAYLMLGEQMHNNEIRGQAFNLGANTPIKVLDVVKYIAKLMDKEHLQPHIENSAKAEISHQYLNSEKANQLIGWKPKVRLSLGLELTIDWYEQFFKQHSSQVKAMESL